MAFFPVLLITLVTTGLILRSHAHGGVVCPPPRGVTCPRNPGICEFEPGCKNEFDWSWHFPGGEKSQEPGAGGRSQKAAAGTWSPYDPKDPSFKFRAGVCGDMAGDKNGDHLRGGKFYWPSDKPAIVGKYKPGGTFTTTIAINKGAHHNGYIEYTLCDVKKCGGEISEECLRSNACQKLVRLKEDRCETNSQDCAPIDPDHPTRWFIPCAQEKTTREDGRFEYKNINFVIPKDVTCEHCVIQFYWTAANNCSPPGFREYFEGPRGPKWWGECKGQSGARGGWVRRPGHKTCGGDVFPEEYYQCLDVAITPGDAGTSDRVMEQQSQPASPTPTASSPAVSSMASPTPIVPTPNVVTSTPAAASPEVSMSISPSPAAPTSTPEASVPIAVTPEATPASQTPIVPTPTVTPGAIASDDNKDPNHPLDFVRFYIDGKTGAQYEVKDGDKIDLPDEGKINMEVVTKDSVKMVQFIVEGERKRWDEFRAPYFWGGDRDGRIGVLARKIKGRYFRVRLVIMQKSKKFNGEIMVKF